RRAAARSRRNSSISATRVDPTSRVTRTGISVRPPKPPTDPVRRHLDLLRGDRSTERAKETLARGERLVTSDHVLVETWLLLGHRLGRNAAERWSVAIRAGAASVEPITSADLEAAFAIGEGFPDQSVSHQFAVMQRLAVFRAAPLHAQFPLL